MDELYELLEEEILRALERISKEIVTARPITRHINSSLSESAPTMSLAGLSAIDELTQSAIDSIYKSIHKATVSAGILGRKSSSAVIGKAHPGFEEIWRSVKDKSIKTYAAQPKMISARVWQPGMNAQIEQTLALGIKDGKSIRSIARDIKKYLINPDTLYRRVKDEEGNLKLSKAASNYHPGQGVYRSAYKNALRYAKNEVNKAYTESKWDDLQSCPAVIGVEIRPSSGRRFCCDVCADLQGVYPKDFKWCLWHVGCFCSIHPVFASEKEIDRITKELLDGKEPTPAEQIETLPKAFKDYVKNHQADYRLPAWIKDNLPELGKRGVILTPEEKVSWMMARAKEVAPEITLLAKRVAEPYGASVTEINFKSEGSILRKLLTEAEGEIRGIKDSVRNTIVVDKDKLAALANDLERANMVVSVKRQQSGMGYSGILANVRTSRGILGEVQANSPEMIFAKEPKSVAEIVIGKERWAAISKRSGLEGGLGHKYYEEWRHLAAQVKINKLPATDKLALRMKELEQLSRDYYTAIRNL